MLQIHYVTTGKATTDQTSVGLVFCKGKIDKEIKNFQVNDQKFAIPPGAPHHRVVAERTFEHPATGIGMFSHMHLRGKDMTFFAKYPDGTVETLLAVPNYSFDWQMSYRWDVGKKKFPPGTKIECIAHFDNSPFNPYNPDPIQGSPQRPADVPGNDVRLLLLHRRHSALGSGNRPEDRQGNQREAGGWGSGGE